MLKKSKISNIKIHSDEWHHSRLAKFTSSEIYRLFGTSFMAYVRLKVGEEMTGKSAKGEIDTESTRWGGFYEAEAIQKFGNKMGLEFLVTQQLITETGSRFGSTPDGLIVKRLSPDDTEYEVETVEVKCPPTYDNYLLLFECETPQDLKVSKKEYYWQVLDQMDNCEALVGNFVAYHPDFRAGNMKHIVFNSNQRIDGPKGAKFPIFEDLKELRQKKREAVAMFEKIRDKLMTAGLV